jgi:hypothetical protein
MDIGLVPYGDYVVGWTEGPLYTESEFYDLVEQVSRSRRLLHTFSARKLETKPLRLLSLQHVEKPLRLYVYSADLECVP